MSAGRRRIKESQTYPDGFLSSSSVGSFSTSPDRFSPSSTGLFSSTASPIFLRGGDGKGAWALASAGVEGKALDAMSGAMGCFGDDRGAGPGAANGMTSLPYPTLFLAG